LADYRELGASREAESHILLNIGIILLSLGEWKNAKDIWCQALIISQELNDKSWSAGLKHNLGALAQETGDLAEARRLFEESLEIERELGDEHGVASAL